MTYCRRDVIYGDSSIVTNSVQLIYVNSANAVGHFSPRRKPLRSQALSDKMAVLTSRNRSSRILWSKELLTEGYCSRGFMFLTGPTSKKAKFCHRVSHRSAKWLIVRWQGIYFRLALINRFVRTTTVTQIGVGHDRVVAALHVTT